MIIRELREKKGITQAKLAEILGVGRTTITMYEKGTIVPPADILRKLADYFNVSVDYLLGREEKDSTETMANKASVLENEFAQRGITAEKFNALPDNKKQLLYNLIIDMIESNGQK